MQKNDTTVPNVVLLTKYLSLFQQRITEIAGVVLSFDPKPIQVKLIAFLFAIRGKFVFMHDDISNGNLVYVEQGDWNGAGAHTNYRSAINHCIELLS